MQCSVCTNVIFSLRKILWLSLIRKKCMLIMKTFWKIKMKNKEDKTHLKILALSFSYVFSHTINITPIHTHSFRHVYPLTPTHNHTHIYSQAQWYTDTHIFINGVMSQFCLNVGLLIHYYITKFSMLKKKLYRHVYFNSSVVSCFMDIPHFIYWKYYLWTREFQNWFLSTKF